MHKWVLRVRKWLRIIYEFFFIILIIDFGICMSERDMMRKEQLIVLGGMLVLSYLARDMLSHAITLFIAHIIIGVITWFVVQDVYFKIILNMALFGIFVDAAMYMKRGYVIKRAFELPWDACVMGIAISILAFYFDNHELQMVGYISVLILLVDYLISIYVEGLDLYMQINRNVKGLPIKQMVSVNSFIVTTICCIIVVIILLADVLGLPKVVLGFFLALVGILKIVFILLRVVYSLVAGLFGGVGGMEPQEGIRRMEQVAEDDGILSKIIYFILVSAIIIAAVYILIKLCKFVIKWLLAKQDKNEVIEDLDTRKKKRVERVHIEKEDSHGVMSYEQRARRIYKKKVLSFRRHFLPDSFDTAGDIEEAMLRFTKEDTPASEETAPESIIAERKETITELYEAVRYGDKTPDRNYLKRMKQL